MRIVGIHIVGMRIVGIHTVWMRIVGIHIVGVHTVGARRGASLHGRALLIHWPVGNVVANCVSDPR